MSIIENADDQLWNREPTAADNCRLEAQATFVHGAHVLALAEANVSCEQGLTADEGVQVGIADVLLVAVTAVAQMRLARLVPLDGIASHAAREQIKAQLLDEMDEMLDDAFEAISENVDTIVAGVEEADEVLATIGADVIRFDGRFDEGGADGVCPDCGNPDCGKPKVKPS